MNRINKMRDFSVLMTCTTRNAYAIAECLKHNHDGVNVKVVAVNAKEHMLPPKNECDSRYVAPRIDSDEYISVLKDICSLEGIDILVPQSSIELEFMAQHKEDFESIGVAVAVPSLAALLTANDKIRLHERFGKFMPNQIIPQSVSEIKAFADKYKSICCKISNSSSGRGFAVIDDVKCNDINLFHAYGEKHYISLEHLCHIFTTQRPEILLQEYHSGNDYSISLLANQGEVSHIIGYIGTELEFGCIMEGAFQYNEQAYNIASLITKELKLDGNIAFDFILKDDGSVVLLEINPRLNASIPWVAKAGMNLPYLRCKQLLGYDIKNECKDIDMNLKMSRYVAYRYHF